MKLLSIFLLSAALLMPAAYAQSQATAPAAPQQGMRMGRRAGMQHMLQNLNLTDEQ